MEIEEYIIDEDTVCGVCHAEFLDVDDLQRHISQYHLTNTNLKNYCPFCAQSFPDSDEYSLHMRNEHFHSMGYCKYCTRFFVDDEILTKHETLHSDTNEKICCSQCDATCDSLEQLVAHEFTEHRFRDDGVMFLDVYPHLSSLLNMNIKLFMQSLRDNLLFTCTRCGFSTFQVSTFIQHLKMENERCFACDDCYRVFKRKETLSRHCKTHMARGNSTRASAPYQCKRCNKIFSRTNLRNHLKTCIDMKCNKCKLSFDSVTKYAEHAAGHAAEKTVPLQVCKYCHRPFVGLVTLQKHIARQHRHEIHLYKYHCKHCDKIFKHPKLLFGHFFSTHKDIKPYICKVCNTSFRMRRNFTLHIKMDHKSVGFVEFDDQFYVHFNDKKTSKSKSDTGEEKNDMDEDVLEENNKNSENDKKSKNLETKIEISHEEAINEESKAINEESKAINEENKANNEENKANNEENKDINEENKANNEENKVINTTETETKSIKEVENRTIVDKSKDDDESRIQEVSTFIINLDEIEERQIGYNVLASMESKMNGSSKRNKDSISDFSSDDSDVPLAKVMKRKKNEQKRKKYKKTKTSKFICSKCNRNCYTYQNFQRHAALHKSNKRKDCIKCHKSFLHENKLRRHIMKKHSRSELTETLKRILQRKTNGVQKMNGETKTSKDETVSDGRRIVPGPEEELDRMDWIEAKTFKSTIKKVDIERCTTPAVITPVRRDKLSAKNFLESFMPDNQEPKITISSSMSIKRITAAKAPPLIKLTKHTPETIVLGRAKLRMPVKYRQEAREVHDVSITVVNRPPVTSSFNLNMTNYYNPDLESFPAAIPDVGEEVMLDGAEKPPTQRTLVIKDFLHTDDIKIAHLWPQEPFYKIVNINNVVNEAPEIEEAKEEEPELTLPNGTKLVNVNPLSHLLGDRDLKDINNARNKTHYQPKVRDIGQALANALMKLNKTKRKDRKRK